MQFQWLFSGLFFYTLAGWSLVKAGKLHTRAVDPCMVLKDTSSQGCGIAKLMTLLVLLCYCSHGNESEIQPPIPAVYLAVHLSVEEIPQPVCFLIGFQ